MQRRHVVQRRSIEATVLLAPSPPPPGRPSCRRTICQGRHAACAAVAHAACAARAETARAQQVLAHAPRDRARKISGPSNITSIENTWRPQTRFCILLPVVAGSRCDGLQVVANALTSPVSFNFEFQFRISDFSSPKTQGGPRNCHRGLCPLIAAGPV